MGKLTVQWTVGDETYRMVKTRSTVSRNGRLTFKTQGPFDQLRRMVVTGDNVIMALYSGPEYPTFDPESGAVLKGRGRWVKVGRYIDDVNHRRVAFIGPDEVPTYEELRLRLLTKKQDSCKTSGPDECATCLIHWTCPMAMAAM